MQLSPLHLLVVLVLALLLFGGKGKLSSIMTDLAQGIKGFKKGLAEEDTKSNDAPRMNDAKTIDAEVINKDKTES